MFRRRSWAGFIVAAIFFGVLLWQLGWVAAVVWVAVGVMILQIGRRLDAWGPASTTTYVSGERQAGVKQKFVARSVVAGQVFVLLGLGLVAWIVGGAVAEEAVGSGAAIAVSLVAPIGIAWLLWRAFHISATLTAEGVEVQSLFRHQSFAWRDIDRVQPAVTTLGRAPMETIGIRGARTSRVLPVLAVAGNERVCRALFDALRLRPELKHAEFEYWRG